MTLQTLQNLVLHSDFDIEIHRRLFDNYLEVMIDSEGVIHYAVPSHQDWMVNYIMNKESMTREQVYKKYEKHILDFFDTMLKEYHCVAVWNNFFVGGINDKQRETFKKLVKAGLYEDSLKNFTNS